MTEPRLDEADVSADPIAEFRRWFDAAVAAGLPDPTAAALATASPDGAPSLRMVLIKGVDAAGFRFYTNYGSRKARELDDNPRAALCFHFAAQARQVRVEGIVERLPAAESDAYFASRDRGSQLGAWASRQSQPLPDRAALEARFAAIASRFPVEVPRPDFWGGYLLKPHTLELWQGRDSRLHDRLRWRRDGAGWLLERLAP